MSERGDFSYPHVGVTAGRPVSSPPAGYHLLRERVRLGSGRALAVAAGEAVLRWRMHHAAGVRVTSEAEVAGPGVRLTVAFGVGPLRIGGDCRVVWTVREPDRVGFAYGTLPGHPERGEESFVVTRDPDDAVWLTVTAVSRPGVWYVGLAGPLARIAQRAAARRYGRALRRVCRGHGPGGSQPERP
ncbi:DUF1990 family protein [Streptomyces millisiae]|uniref:DUF1990 domain-containing protein n=1 Tax=Streptomyces millisiae TaxID=3075542 RepID=A0ABU2LTQ1_9ACTN|nr:DUF1990 domain-containing protein [Streptomyces sp. DSM 44918]MDT0320979.1 DUF1990 domain-containing protein [Streptomyces sp. DSM 44918]